MSDDQWLEDEVRQLKDIIEISQLKASYCRFVDTKDWAGYRDLLTENFHFVSDGRVQDGREEVVSFVSKALASATTVHHVHSPEIGLTGPDKATAIWAMNDYVMLPGAGSPFVLRGYGHYHEEYVRIENGWRMKSSELTRLRVDTEGDVPGEVSDLAESSA